MSTASGKLVLSLFGPFQAALGAFVLQFATDRAQALLAYLAVEQGRAQRREALATLLWPQAPPAAALLNLRVTLHRLRAALDRAEAGLSSRLLITDRRTIRLDAEWLAVDVTLFQAQLSAVRAHPHRDLRQCSDCLAWLTQAAALYRGELLAGFALDDSPPFDEWLLMQREAHQRQAVRLLSLLADAQAASGDLAAAIESARRIVTLDPFHEAAHRQLLRLLLAAARPHEALAHYDALSRLLRRELGIEPEEATRMLAAQARHDQRPAAGVAE